MCHNGAPPPPSVCRAYRASRWDYLVLHPLRPRVWGLAGVFSGLHHHTATELPPPVKRRGGLFRGGFREGTAPAGDAEEPRAAVPVARDAHGTLEVTPLPPRSPPTLPLLTANQPPLTSADREHRVLQGLRTLERLTLLEARQGRLSTRVRHAGGGNYFGGRDHLSRCLLLSVVLSTERMGPIYATNAIRKHDRGVRRGRRCYKNTAITNLPCLPKVKGRQSCSRAIAGVLTGCMQARIKACNKGSYWCVGTRT